MSCCPPESLGQLGEEDYKPRGSITNRGDLPIYVVGSGSKAIIWNYDIFGFDSGRTKQLCDIVADAGSLTFQRKIHPNLFSLFSFLFLPTF